MRHQTKYTLQERCKQSKSILDTKRVPIIVEPGEGMEPLFPETKFIMPADSTGGQFFISIRKRMQLDSEKALFLFVHTTKTSDMILLPQNELMQSIYGKYHNPEDKLLYLVYTLENTFG